MLNVKTIKKTALAPTVLISHGGSLLASHLAETLLLKNCRVVVLSNFKQNTDPHLHDLLKSPKFALFDCDVNQELPESIESVDYIFHLANYDNFLNLNGKVDLDSLLSASIGTKNLLDLAKKSQAKMALVSPLVSKAVAEKSNKVNLEEAQKYSSSLALEYRQKWEVDVRLVYLGCVYGPRMDLSKSGDLESLLENVLEERELNVVNDGIRKEFYIYFSDAINGLVKSLFSSSQKEIFTLIEEKPHTTLEVAYILKSLANGRLEITFADSKESFIEPEYPTIQYPTSWSPKVELKNGLVKTLKSFGYKPNLKAFKAGALIDQKQLEEIVSTAQKERENLETLSSAPEYAIKISPITLIMCRLEKQARTLLKNIQTRKTVSDKVKFIGLGAVGIIALISVFLGVPLIQTYGHARSALNNLEEYQVSISQLDSEKSQILSENAYEHIYKLQKALSRTSLLFKISGKAKTYNSLQAFVESSKNFTSALYSFSLGAEPLSGLWDGLKPDGKVDIKADEFKQAAASFMDAKQKLNFAQASLSQVDEKYLPNKIKPEFARYQTMVAKMNENSDFVTQLALDLPQIIGLDGPKRYLFLFQNNNEIRPTGGFLGSYGVVELENGRIIKIDINDVYNPDGQLKLSQANESVTSPLPIKNALEEEVLYIRNANWNPSFPDSGKTINSLFKLVDGKGFDGIFAVDLYFARDLLSITGPLYLSAYDEEIRVDNMYERVQFHSDFDFKEGVSTKQAFMTVLGGKMLERLFSLPQEKIPALLSVLYSSLEQKHFILDFPGTVTSKYLAERSWDGSLIDTQGDYLYVVNANLGGTKSNYYVRNSMNYAISSKTSDGVLRSELELIYENTQQDASWPGGPYKDYVRVLVQNGSKLTGAFLIGGSDTVADKDTTDVMGAANGMSIFDKVIISKVGQYTSFEYPIVVNPQEKITLLFNYDLPSSLSATKDTNKYNLVWQKQPGTQNDAVRFLFTSPFGTQITQSIPQGSITANIYEYKSVLNSDLRVSLVYK